MNDAANNPYTPPRSEVFDIPPSEERMDRPQHVFYAVALLWLTLVIQAAGLAFMWRLYRLMPLEFLVFAGITTVMWALNAFIVAMIERGRNWARITYLVIFLLGLPFIVMMLFLAFAQGASNIGVFSMVVQVLLQIAAMIMLFVPPAGAWFRGDPPPEESRPASGIGRGGFAD